MQEDTSQEQSAVDFVDNKWTSSTQLLSSPRAKRAGLIMLSVGGRGARAVSRKTPIYFIP